MAWQIEDKAATVRGKKFVGCFDLAKPNLGLKLSCDDAVAAVDPLFAFLVEDLPEETYVRGTDLVTRYPPRKSDLVSFHSYYRLTPAADGLEFILSAQTNLLESAPLTKVMSSFRDARIFVMQANGASELATDGEVWEPESAPKCFLVRPRANANGSTWVVLIHPSDFYRASVRTGTESALAFEVFPTSLEKGVIRRASFQARLVPQAQDEQFAVDLFSSMLEAAPPLAT